RRTAPVMPLPLGKGSGEGKEGVSNGVTFDNTVKITDLTTHVVHVNPRGNRVFVQVATDAGLVGTGEASHSGNDALCIAALKQMGASLVGKDPRWIEAHWQRLTRLASGRVERTALSAIEQALWHILGQSLNAPIHQLLGGAVREKNPPLRQHQSRRPRPLG
ncbi:MAG: hypothetical protein NZT92_20675, partial [Abditibacteriales bacterium]|nr:hypothetical protein [Abditibacteriales bacterium]MDW8368129.1 hypothetical protein [Abditibacteriales bacterium]